MFRFSNINVAKNFHVNTIVTNNTKPPITEKGKKISKKSLENPQLPIEWQREIGKIEV